MALSCGGLPRALRNQIAAGKDRACSRRNASCSTRSKRCRTTSRIRPTCSRARPVSTEWPARLQSARGTLDRAKNDLQQLDKLSDPRRAEQLLSEERGLRQSVVRDAESVEADANSWLDFERNVPHYLAAMQREYDEIHAVDLTPVSEVVQKAEQDWPAKKAALDGRLAALRQSSEAAETQWTATESAQARRGGRNRDRARDRDADPGERRPAARRQPAHAWRRRTARRTAASSTIRGTRFSPISKSPIAEARRFTPRKFTTVRTHYVDVAAKKTEISTDNKWVDVPASSYRAVENDLGMVIAHKDAGLFDSEAQNKVQPPGFAYIASPSSRDRTSTATGATQAARASGLSCPQYLLMRELLWGHSYRPIYVNEYNGFQTALRSGRTYYGQETPASPPKYGSHGTFTAQRYASSRYVQSGGYSGSAYASNRSAAPSSRPESGFSPRGEDGSAGKRFGGSSGGQKFGGSHESPGQRFGSPRPSPLAPRGFGRRR